MDRYNDATPLNTPLPNTTNMVYLQYQLAVSPPRRALFPFTLFDWFNLSFAICYLTDDPIYCWTDDPLFPLASMPPPTRRISPFSLEKLP